MHKVTDTKTVVSMAFEVLEKCVARDSSVRSDFDSLDALRLLSEGQSSRGLNDEYIAYWNHPGYGALENLERHKVRPVFPTLEYIYGCGDSVYSGPVGRGYSVQSTPSLEYMESFGPAMNQLYQCDTFLPPMNTNRCTADLGYYDVTAQYRGHEGGGTIQVTQGYTSYPDNHLH